MGSDDCIFCKIASGQIPASKVFEDDACIAFMDINPLADGHLLLIPKTHAETLDKLTEAQAGQVVAHVGAAMLAALREYAGPGPRLSAVIFDFDGSPLWRGQSLGEAAV